MVLQIRDMTMRQNRAVMHSLEVGQCQVLGAKVTKGTEEGKGLELSGSPIRICITARMCEQCCSAAVSKKLIKSISAACMSETGALLKAKSLYDSQVQRPGG